MTSELEELIQEMKEISAFEMIFGGNGEEMHLVEGALSGMSFPEMFSHE